MARKRVTLPEGAAGFDAASAVPAPDFRPAPLGSPPIAQVAGEASARAALADLAEEMATARASGRMVQALPLAMVDADWMYRDRMAADSAEMADLVASIRDRGQQAPIEVVALEDGRFGLISGWRRLMALRQLQAETGDPRFAAIQALLRRPESAGAAYRAMVEENEIRAGLSYYERARIAALAAGTGAFADPQKAIAALFAAASKAKRSKIGSFLTLHRSLGDHLRFGSAIPERLGLKLAAALEADRAFATRLRDRLRKASPADAAAELALLTRAFAGPEKAPPPREEIRPGLWLEEGAGRLVLSGKALDGDLRRRLADWLRDET